MTTSFGSKGSPSDRESTVGAGGQERVDLRRTAQDALVAAKHLHDDDRVEMLGAEDRLGALEVDVRGLAGQDLIGRAESLDRVLPGHGSGV
jgi:hypothetical protein